MGRPARIFNKFRAKTRNKNEELCRDGWKVRWKGKVELNPMTVYEFLT